MNDTDLEMAALEGAARHETALRKRGVCTHGSLQGAHPVFAPELRGAQIKCRDCGRVFADLEDCLEERNELLS